MIKGSMVALITPFINGVVDTKKITELVNWHIENNTSAIVPCGTTGESATLSHKEHQLVIETVVAVAAGKIKVIAGTGSNNTDEAIKLTQHAKDSGADAALMICPYYNKPTQNGLFEHFKTVAKNVDIPIILYNIASRTGVNFLPQTVAELSKINNIVAIKEASGDLSQMAEVIKLSAPGFSVISGDDALTLPLMSIGGTGIISVVANILPKKTADLVKACEEGNLKLAQEIHYELFDLVKAMFIETNPVPVKTAMELMGKCSSEVRLPLFKMDDSNLEILKKMLKQNNLI
ncbi:MAG: 4-hydroxy-tetrahydrodipicolinate synthase [bacterium]|nr:4-hydroxy-tetrahydrodipicolinate synthase [bacterium]